MTEEFQRRLAAIVAADVVGYSAMMSADEHRTIAAVQTLQRDTIEPLTTRHGGRIVKTMGDGFLIEFASIVAAVQAAVSIQQGLEPAAAEAPEGTRIRLRIGIHVGDIVIEGDDIFGDGVNIAARIEPLARPGSVGISEEAYNQVRDRLDVEWTDGGFHELKNIPRPLRIWHWGLGTAPPPLPKAAAPQLPDRPSVAVLPFDNMSSDPDQEHFADGMTEDLITDLSKISGLFVVARNSTFALKGQASDIPTVARRLGVAHIVEGSVRKMGERVRINVQLIDAATGGHLWADRYDGSLAAVFELQDDVCAKVVEALSVQLTQTEATRLREVHTTNVAAYELFVRAKSTPYPPVPARITAAADLFQQVVDAAPDFAGGYAGLAWMVSFGALWGHEDPAALGTRAEALAHKAIAIDAGFGWSHTALGLAFLAQRRFDEAIEASQKGLELLPNDPDAHAFLAVVQIMRGQAKEAIANAAHAVRLTPDFVNGPYLNLRSLAHLMAGEYDQTVHWHETNVARGGPVGPPALCWAAASYQALGDTVSAAAKVATLTAQFPDFGLKNWNQLELVEQGDDRRALSALFHGAGIPD